MAATLNRLHHRRSVGVRWRLVKDARHPALLLPLILQAACGHLTGPPNTGGTPVSLSFSVQPTTSTAGTSIPPIQVVAHDAAGKLATSFNGSVTVAIATNVGGGTLRGSTTVSASGGVATFGNLSIDKAGTGYRLNATSGSLAPATSGKFDITGGPATHLVFTIQPSTAAADKSISPGVRVAAEDSLGNTDGTFIGTVTIVLAQDPPGGTLSGTTTVAAVAGAATFSTLSLDKVGSGYTLAASASGLTAGTSAAFAIIPGSATHIVFSTQPSGTTAGVTITPAVQVTALDTAGNTATGYIGNVTLVITGGTGTSGATLSGTRTIAAAAGVATFSTLSINFAGTGYTLTAMASGTTGTISAPFNITAGSPDSLVFTVQPTATTAGSAITPAVQLAAKDSLGNTGPSFTGTVTVAIAPGTGTAGASLSGTTTVAAVAGVATFSTLAIDTSGTGYRLTAAASGLPGTTSSAFAITAGAATKLLFTVQPTTTTAGKTISPSVRVTAVDSFGNTDLSFSGNVTVALGQNPGGGTLNGTLTVAAFGGVATFSTLSIANVGTGYTLTATANGLTGATSALFNIM